MKTRKLTHTTITTVAVLGTTATKGRRGGKAGTCARPPTRTQRLWPQRTGRDVRRVSAQPSSPGPATARPVGAFDPRGRHRITAPGQGHSDRGPGSQQDTGRRPPTRTRRRRPRFCPRSYLRRGGGWPGCAPRGPRRRGAPGGRTEAARPCGWRAPRGWPRGSRSPAGETHSGLNAAPRQKRAAEATGTGATQRGPWTRLLSG